MCVCVCTHGASCVNLVANVKTLECIHNQTKGVLDVSYRLGLLKELRQEADGNIHDAEEQVQRVG